MKKTAKFICAVVCFVLVVSCCLVACDKQEEYKWQIADGITAQFTDNGHYGFILTVSGKGAIPDYNSSKDTPWYSKSGRVTEIVIEEGITAVGDNAFSYCLATEIVVLPKTLTSVGNNSFAQDTMLFAYNEVTADQGVQVYLYSENYKAGYWGFRNGIPTLWTQLKILFIGNSFTLNRNIPQLVEDLALSLNQDVEVSQITKGAWTLSKFADPNDQYGAQVDKTLRSEQFDIIVLQEQSTRPLDNFNEFENAVKSLTEKINSTQRNCQVYLYSTWAYQSMVPEDKTIAETELQLRNAYKSVADKFNLGIVNVGQAFTAVYEQHKDINIYDTDGKHQSDAGAFLSACVHVATLLNCDPRQSDFCGEVDENTAETLKQVAYEVVFGETL